MGRIWLFRLIPFVDFILVAGSMAMGNPCEDSDFDVIVGVRRGRIFSAVLLLVCFRFIRLAPEKVLRGVRARL